MQIPVFTLLLGFSLVASAATYRWKDADGNTVFSQIPPADNAAVETVKPPPPPAESAETARQRLQDRILLLDDAREDRKMDEKTAQKAQLKHQDRQKQCQAARYNLKGLQQKSRQKVSSKNGEYRRLTAEERQQRIVSQENIIKKTCQ